MFRLLSLVRSIINCALHGCEEFVGLPKKKRKEKEKKKMGEGAAKFAWCDNAPRCHFIFYPFRVSRVVLVRIVFFVEIYN